MTANIENTAGTANITVKGCACNCGREIGKRSTFAPGHDARMVSNVAGYVVNGGDDSLVPLVLTSEPSLNNPDAVAEIDIQDRIDLAGAAIERHFSKALAVKFDGAAHTAWAKAVGTSTDTQTKDGRVRRAKAPKAAAPVAPAPAPAPAEAKRSVAADKGEVRIGRWTYPAKRFDSGDVVYTNRQGVELTAGATVAATFTFAS